MATLYELAEELAKFELEIDEDTGEVLNLADLDKVEMEFKQKVEGICLWIKNLKSDALAYKAEKDSFTRKQREAEKKAESLSRYVQGVLRGEKFKTNRVAVSYRKSEVVECSDLSKVSEQFLRFKDPELDKTAVTPIDVAMMMVLLKAARVSTGGVSHYDNYVDVAGYAACAYEITKEWNGESDASNRENLVRAN